MSRHQLTMHIDEDHNEVLEPIYRAIGSKNLAFSGNTMLHFDSHPDLLIPSGLPADSTFDKTEVERLTSIENWIMPLVYAGHVSTVVWVKKVWATQIADGHYEFVVGKDPETGCIRCSCAEPYFVSELLYSPGDQLCNTKPLVLIVVTYDSVEDSIDDITSRLQGLTEGSDIILDIDFDYFSTMNPFAEIYSSKQLELLSTLYKFVVESTPERSATRREEQLDFLCSTIKLVVDRRGNVGQGDNSLEACDDKRVADVELLVDEEISQRGKADADILHEHGCTFDTTGLPHHISSTTQIDIYIADMIHLLRTLNIRPKIITASRSSDDDYCPKHQVDIIEDKTISALQTLYKDLFIKKHYLNKTS